MGGSPSVVEVQARPALVLTQHGQSGVGRNGAGRVPGGAAVQAHVLRFDVRDEEHVVVGHDVHPALPGGGEICAAVLLPGDLRCGVALGGALQSGLVTRPDGAVSGRLDEGRKNCGQNIQMRLRTRRAASAQSPSALPTHR